MAVQKNKDFSYVGGDCVEYKIMNEFFIGFSLIINFNSRENLKRNAVRNI